MSDLLQDFFRPDITASNKALKKYLEAEGLSLSFRALVSLRRAAQRKIFFSLAFIEAWSASEFTSADTCQLIEASSSIKDLCSAHGWSCYRTGDDAWLVGLDGELEDFSVPEPANDEDLQSSSTNSLVPLRSVYGDKALVDSPGLGGAWREEELQQASLTLLDGEAGDKLVEAFRYLFRAAPSGSSRAAVCVAALARHRDELNLEVADKLEEFAPALGQTLRNLFSSSNAEIGQSLEFLLAAELAPEPASWVEFWKEIKMSVLEGLAGKESGRRILCESLPALSLAAKRCRGRALSPRLVDVFLADQDLLSSQQRSSFLHLLERFAEHDSSCLEVLTCKLNFCSQLAEKILLGEAVRRIYVKSGQEDELARLLDRFSHEALLVGSTAGSLALAEFLGAFGLRALENNELTRLDSLSERQVLNVITMWSYLLEENPEVLGRVCELFIDALDKGDQQLALLLKSPLLQRGAISSAFRGWYQGLSLERRRMLARCGENWLLTAPNRLLVAEAVSSKDWGGEELWFLEWRKTTLNFQRLGWYSLCLKGSLLRGSPEIVKRTLALLESPPRNLYFWDFIRQLSKLIELPQEVNRKIVASARSLALTLAAELEEERDTLVLAATEALLKDPDPKDSLSEWEQVLRTGGLDELLWTFSIIKSVFASAPSFDLPRTFVSSLVQRLFAVAPDSMQQALEAALNKGEQGLELAPVLSLDVQNLGFEALAAVAYSFNCPADIKKALQQRLLLFLARWAQDLATTDDLYSFRETPLFKLTQPLIDASLAPLQLLIDEVTLALLEIQKNDPERLNLESRQSVRSFLLCWVDFRREVKPLEATAWSRVLKGL